MSLRFALATTSRPIPDADVKAFFDKTLAPHVGQNGLEAVAMTYFSFPEGSDTPRLVSFSAGTCYNLDSNAVGAPQPATSMYRIASVTKVYTTTALWQLHEQGRLDLDARIEDLLPSLASRMEGHIITVRDLLRHTLPLDENALDSERRGDGTPFMSAIDALDKHFWTAWTSSADAPRRISYSNHGSAIGGAIIEAVTGMTIDEYFQQYLYKPIGANNTAFHREFRGDYSNVCLPSKARETCAAPYEIYDRGSGDLYATTEDAARFLAGQVSPLSGFFARKETSTEMLARAWPESDALPANVYNGIASLWGLDQYRGVRMISKGGDLYEASCEGIFFPDTRDGFFFVGSPGGPIRRDVKNQWVTAFRSNASTDGDQPLAPTQMEDWQARAIVGNYKSARSAAQGMLTATTLFEHRRIETVADDPLGAIDVGPTGIRYVAVAGSNHSATRVVFANTTEKLGTKYLVATFDPATKRCLQVEMPSAQATLLPLTIRDNKVLVLLLMSCAAVVLLASLVAFCLLPLGRIVGARVHKIDQVAPAEYAPLLSHAGDDYESLGPAPLHHDQEPESAAAEVPVNDKHNVPAIATTMQQTLQLILAVSSIVLLGAVIAIASVKEDAQMSFMRGTFITVAVCLVMQVVLVCALYLCIVVRIYAGAKLTRKGIVGWAILFVLNVCSIPGLVWTNFITMHFW
ncbi:hypothetical protein RI367_006082 [Sorochytrium milnesiophthora]